MPNKSPVKTKGTTRMLRCRGHYKISIYPAFVLAMVKSMIPPNENDTVKFVVSAIKMIEVSLFADCVFGLI